MGPQKTSENRFNGKHIHVHVLFTYLHTNCTVPPPPPPHPLLRKGPKFALIHSNYNILKRWKKVMKVARKYDESCRSNRTSSLHGNLMKIGTHCQICGKGGFTRQATATTISAFLSLQIILKHMYRC